MEVSSQVIAIPMVIKLITTFPTDLSSEIFKLNPPSNSIIATEIETNGNSRFPK